MNKELIENFKSYFINLQLDNYSDLDNIYSEDVVFKDPMHTINGRENLKKYFQKLNSNLEQGSFLFLEESVLENKAYLTWEMNFTIKGMKNKVKASGISVLTFTDKVTNQRDYFDAGEVFYENIPLLSSVIRWIKKKLAG